MTSNQAAEGDKNSAPRAKFAAGGIVWRRSSHGLEVAIIHRTRYGGEWCLPKGKPDPNKKETWEEVALREVKEETGCDGKITSFAGTTSYIVDVCPKVVLFWNMEIEEKCSFKPSEEVDKIEWLKPKKAIARLDHLEEKNLLTKAYYGRFPIPRFRPFSLFKSKQYHRLAGSLSAYRTELEHRICLTGKNKEADRCWIGAARNLLAQAELALFENNIDEGWKCFHTATRMEILGYNDNELKNAAATLRHEADKKLNKWRQKATFEIIGHPDFASNSQTAVPNKENVFLATFLRDEHFNNTYHKISLRRANLFKLFFVLIFGVIALPILTKYSFLSDKIGDWKTVVAIELFGILGASLSVALTLTRRSIDSKIPDQVIGSFVTWMRPAIGAIAAVAAYIFLQTGIVDNIVGPVLKGSNEGMLAVAFVAGFSERIIMRMVESVKS